MREPHYERMSTLDASFLAVEDRNAPMSVGSVSLFDARPLRLPGGGLDFSRIERAIQQILPKNRRLRQKVWWPTGGFPVWIDDPDFRLGYHLRHSALPRPGTADQLKRLAGSILSRTLDLEKPLWEIWIVEGVEDDRFAIISKIHHCLADGISIRDILLGYLEAEPTSVPRPIGGWDPRPAPSLARIHLDAALRRAQKSREFTDGIAQGVAKLFTERPDIGRWTGALGGWLGAASSFAGRISDTPINNCKIGPHRRFDYTSTDLASVKEIRKHSGAKVNDIVLAAVTGAVRRFLLAQKLCVDDLDFRVMVPVNVRTEQENGTFGNRVSNMTVPLPLVETDPRRRLQRVIDATQRAKMSRQSQVGDLLAQFVDNAGLFLPREWARQGAHQMAANLVVTNVPGPQFTQYLLEGEMYESFPVVPLPSDQALGVALYSYNGTLFWGFNADLDLIPELQGFVGAIDLEMEQLRRAHDPISVRSRAKLRMVPGVDEGHVADGARVQAAL
jgi:diacylglycerol O-acyltransferase / wax synthase